MRLRITKVDEYQLLTCIKNNVWGSKNARFKQWELGDYLAIIVDRDIAALAQVSGPPYESQESVWDNGLFPHRIPISFVHAAFPKNRRPVLGKIRDALMEAWGVSPQYYGWGILNQRLLDGEHAHIIVNEIIMSPNDLTSIQEQLNQLLAQSKGQSATKATVKQMNRENNPIAVTKVISPDVPQINTPNETDEGPAHTRAQGQLIALGRITGCSVWVASNDRNRLYNGSTLGEQCLPSLPNMGFSKEAQSRISLIDVIWVRDNAPLCAFEVETTTSVYSGLLRMSDLLALVPAIKIQLFIVAPSLRQKKVMDELSRPTFAKIGLSNYCRFVATETLDTLVSQVASLAGHVQPTILDTIALSLPSEPPSALQ